MKKKILATTALLSGTIIGFLSVLAIDATCKRPSKKKNSEIIWKK